MSTIYLVVLSDVALDRNEWQKVVSIHYSKTGALKAAADLKAERYAEFQSRFYKEDDTAEIYVKGVETNTRINLNKDESNE